MASLGLRADSGKTTAAIVRGVAPAIALNHNDHFHLGCYYRDPETQSVFLLDFPRDGIVRRQEGSQPEYVWVTPSLTFMDLTLLASSCAAVYIKYQDEGPNFALDYVARFNADLSLTVAGPRGGFTCATFVMAIFEFANIKLIDIETWMSRPDDRVWQQWVLDVYVTDRSARDNVIEQIRSDIGCFRYRPEEVMAAAILKRHPAPFKKVKPVAKKVSEFVRRLGRRL